MGSNHFIPIGVHANTGDPAYGIFFGEYHRRYTADFDVLFQAKTPSLPASPRGMSK
jgi:hypothetical protein